MLKIFDMEHTDTRTHGKTRIQQKQAITTHK